MYDINVNLSHNVSIIFSIKTHSECYVRFINQATTKATPWKNDLSVAVSQSCCPIAWTRKLPIVKPSSKYLNLILRSPYLSFFASFLTLSAKITRFPSSNFALTLFFFLQTQNADLIVVINKGKIVEIGKSRELLEKGGLYRKLYDSQFKYEPKKVKTINRMT